MDLFYPLGGDPTSFKFPEGRKLRIEGCLTKEELANPTEVDSDGRRCLIVGKDGNTVTICTYTAYGLNVIMMPFWPGGYGVQA